MRRVEDEATAALMALFYRGLWVENKTPLAALRDAQLYLYRNPQALPRLAKMRSVDFTAREVTRTADMMMSARAPMCCRMCR